MVKCKDCKNCSGIDYYIWYEEDGTKHREWMYFCELDGYVTEETAENGGCPNYDDYVHGNITKNA